MLSTVALDFICLSHIAQQLCKGGIYNSHRKLRTNEVKSIAQVCEAGNQQFGVNARSDLIQSPLSFHMQYGCLMHASNSD